MLLYSRRANTKSEDIFIIYRNTSSAILSNGHLVCLHDVNQASALGYDVDKPATSNLALFAGPVRVGTAGIATQAWGRVQVHGRHPSVYLRNESNGGIMNEGQVYGPVNGQWYGRSDGYGHALGPLVLMSRIAAGTFEAQAPCFVRAL